MLITHYYRLTLALWMLIICIALPGCKDSSSPNSSTEPYSHPDLRDRSLVVNSIRNLDYYTGSPDECAKVVSTIPIEFKEWIPDSVGSPSAPIYFTISVHIEVGPYLEDRTVYLKDVARLWKMSDIIKNHQGRMTVGAQRPFTTWVKNENDPILSNLAQRGNEISLHIHEDYLMTNHFGMEYPGVDSGAAFAALQTDESWIAALDTLKTEVEILSNSQVLTFSGSPFYENRYYTLAKLGFEANYNFKDPTTQTSGGEGFLVINPWRPASPKSLETMQQYDRNGAIVYIPFGVFPVHCTTVGVVPIPYCCEGFDYVTRALRASLHEVDSNKINVFNIVIHPNNFENPSDDQDEYKAWNNWLTKIIDPLVADGRLRWSTFIEVSRLYAAWEKDNVH